MDMITKSFQNNFQNQFKASRQIFHKTTGAKLFYGFFIGLPLIFIILKVYAGEGFTQLEFGFIPTWLLLFLMFGYPLVFTPAIQYFQLRKAFNSNPSAQQKQHYEISEKGVKIFGEGFSVELGWENIPRIELSKDFVLLFISKNCAYYLPKQLISNDEYKQLLAWKKLISGSI
ncbi:YcxB family protein [Sessilibacter sp. MAH2]